jgi:prevent-host-death family protein
MLVETEKMIPVTKLQRELTQKLKEVSEKGGPVYVLRNNEMAAVILSTEEYELLKQAEEVLEHLEIAEKIQKRLKSHNRSKNIPWEKIKRKHGLSG